MAGPSRARPCRALVGVDTPTGSILAHMPVRTAVLGSGVAAAAFVPLVLGTVPVGQVWLIKSLLLYSVFAGSSNSALCILSAASGAFICPLGSALAQNTGSSYTGEIALASGDQIQAISQSGSLSAWASGSKLVL